MCHTPMQECRQGAHIPSFGSKPIGGYTTKCVMHGLCDARPTITSPAAEHSFAMHCLSLMLCVRGRCLFCILVLTATVIVRFMSRYALQYGHMSSPMGRNALYCSMRYGVDISSIFSVRFNPGRVIWKRHMRNTSPELQTKVDVLKDMLMYREDKRQCIFTNEELEITIRYVCTE